jgi:hypothetical protein
MPGKVLDLFEHQWRRAMAHGDAAELRRLCLHRVRMLSVKEPGAMDLVAEALRAPGSPVDAPLAAARSLGFVPGDATTWALLAVGLGCDPAPAFGETATQVIARWARIVARARRALVKERGPAGNEEVA